MSLNSIDENINSILASGVMIHPVTYNNLHDCLRLTQKLLKVKPDIYIKTSVPWSSMMLYPELSDLIKELNQRLEEK